MNFVGRLQDEAAKTRDVGMDSRAEEPNFPGRNPGQGVFRASVHIFSWMARRRTLLALSLCLLAFCSRSGKPDATTAAAARAATDGTRCGDTLVVGIPADADTLNPIVARTVISNDLDEFLFPSFLQYRFDCGVSFEPYYAESWDSLNGGRDLRFTLRKDIFWSDGKPITADDCVFSFSLYKDPAAGSPKSGYMRRVQGIEKTDDRTVVFHFVEPYDLTTELSHCSQPIVPAHILKQADRSTLRANPFGRNPVGAGPYRLEKWVPNQEIVLAADEKFSPRAYLDRVVFRVIPDYAARVVELEKGTLDLVDGLLVSDLEPLSRKHPELRLVPRGYRSMDFVGWNLRDELFSRKPVRNALALAVDRDTLIRALFSSGGKVYARPSVGTITPELCRIHNDSIVPLPYAPAQARAILESEGWRDRDGDGILEGADGKEFRFELMTNAGNPRREMAAVIIQEQLRKIGVQVEVSTLESQAFFDRLQKKKFQACLSGWSAGLFVDPSSFWHSGASGTFNFVSYANPAVDGMIDRGLQETDPEKARAIWKDMQRLIYNDQPYLFLYWREDVAAVHKRFRDVGTNVLSSLYNLENWWVPADERKYRSP